MTHLVIGNYTILQWLTFFMTYCIFGWGFESTYCSLKSGKLMNRGFCRGPWLPIYGTGATLFVMLSGPFRSNGYLVYLFGMIGGTLLELFTGVAMFHIFKVRYWDYSQNPLNFRGYICLGASMGWGFIAIFVADHVQPIVERISQNWSYMTFVVINTILYTLFIEDVITSVIAAIDLRNKIIHLAKNSAEIEKLRSSIADLYTKLGEARVEMSLGLSEAKEMARTEGAVATAKAGFNVLTQDARNAMNQQRQQMEERIAALQKDRDQTAEGVSWWSRAALRNNPEASSNFTGFTDIKDMIMRHGSKLSPFVPILGRKNKKK